MKTRRTPTGRPKRPKRRLCLRGRYRAHVWQIEEASEADEYGNLTVEGGRQGNLRAYCKRCFKPRLFHPTTKAPTWLIAAQRAA